MKKGITLLLLGALVFVSHAQTITFQPKWKVGDKKMVSHKVEQIKFVNDSLKGQTEEVSEYQVEILKENATSFEIKFVTKNALLTSVENLYEKLGEEMKPYGNLVLIYKVNKADGQVDLTNWEEAQNFMKSSLEQILKLVKKKDKDGVALVKLMLDPIVSIFDSKENTSAYMEDYIKWVVLPFGKNFVLGDTLKVKTSEPNPLNPGQSLFATEKYVLHKSNADSYSIDYILDIDMGPFIETMKSMISDMGESVGVEQNAIDKKSKELENIKLDMVTSFVLTYDNNIGWVQTLQGNAIISGSEPTQGSFKSINNISITYK
ncbi:MAG: hypothetical protein SFW35_04710 [Chitinophagales bacterium]|nr:hypothetical protein [Chitinophagales bacterium]